jgi:predicted deacylase
VNEHSLALAGCFDVGLLMMLRTEGATVSTAALAGIPAALVEVGGEGRWSEEEVDVQRAGLHRAAQLVGVLPGSLAAAEGSVLAGIARPAATS